MPRTTLPCAAMLAVAAATAPAQGPAWHAWLGEHFTVRAKPGQPFRSGRRYYYLHGVKRACELAHVALFQGRDWYFEGAELIMRQQRSDGSWGRILDDCFAILFLKKAVIGPITQRR